MPKIISTSAKKILQDLATLARLAARFYPANQRLYYTERRSQQSPNAKRTFSVVSLKYENIMYRNLYSNLNPLALACRYGILTLKNIYSATCSQDVNLCKQCNI